MLHDELPLDRRPRSFGFLSAYQGMMDYRHASLEGRLHFRTSTVPWLFGNERGGKSVWNYANEEEFERQHNGNHGMLTHGNEPVTAEVLAAFRAEHFPMAKTGYFDHLTMAWVESDPISDGKNASPSHLSWIASCAVRTEKAIADATSDPSAATYAELRECIEKYMPRTRFTDAARQLLARSPAFAAVA